MYFLNAEILFVLVYLNFVVCLGSSAGEHHIKILKLGGKPFFSLRATFPSGQPARGWWAGLEPKVGGATTVCLTLVQ